MHTFPMVPLKNVLCETEFFPWGLRAGGSPMSAQEHVYHIPRLAQEHMLFCFARDGAHLLGFCARNGARMSNFDSSDRNI